jgi:O-Antigen ligase
MVTPEQLELEAAPPRGLVRSAIAVGAVLVFFTYLDNYAYIAWSGPPALQWVYALVGCAVGVAAYQLQRLPQMAKSPVLLWLGFYFLSTTLWSLWVMHLIQFQQVMWDRYRSMGFLLACAIVFLEPRPRRAAVLAIGVAVAFGALVNLAELLDLVRFEEGELLDRVIGRAAGFYINPNDAATTLVLGLAIALPALPAPLRAPLLVLGGAGVAASFSRGGSLCFVLLSGWLFWRRILGRKTLFALGAAGLVVIAASGGASALLDSRLLNENTSARVRFSADDSGRLSVAEKAMGMFLDAPVLGHGLGATTVWDTSASSHNTYLNLAGDQGIVGLLTFPLLLVALWRANRASAPVVLVLAAAGIFSHGMLDSRSALLAIAVSMYPDPGAAPDEQDEGEGEWADAGGMR